MNVLFPGGSTRRQRGLKPLTAEEKSYLTRPVLMELPAQPQVETARLASLMLRRTRPTAVSFRTLTGLPDPSAKIVGHFLYTLIRDLRCEPDLLTAADGNKRAKVSDTGHFTVADTADFDLCGDLFDTTDSVFRFSPSVAAIFTVPSSSISMVVPVSSVSARICAAFTVTSFDLVRADLDGDMDTRRKFQRYRRAAPLIACSIARGCADARL